MYKLFRSYNNGIYFQEKFGDKKTAIMVMTVFKL